MRYIVSPKREARAELGDVWAAWLEAEEGVAVIGEIDRHAQIEVDDEALNRVCARLSATCHIEAVILHDPLDEKL